MAARKNGRWGNTQENAVAMQALVDYYRKYESHGAELHRDGRSSARRICVRATFKGRSTDARRRDVPMAALARAARRRR